MTLTLRDSITRLSDPRNLDASVEEVFGMMLGWECRRAEADCDAREADSLTAMVGFGGVLSGADARAKLAAGADLVQVYTGLIYQGPALVRACAAAMARA